jgi:rSAM/selenodomain-associated transferase 1
MTTATSDITTSGCQLYQLVVFARAPRYGRVKTRLAADIGHLQALQFYRRNLKHLIRELRHGSWQLHIAVAAPDDAHHPLFAGLPIVVQSRGDLGRRMRFVFQQFHRQHCIIVGSDIPFIRQQHIKSAFTHLQRNHYVFGPAKDGGYWLAGCRAGTHRRRHLMSNVRWSGEFALSDTLAGLSARHRIALTDALFDVDNITDYIEFQHQAHTAEQ